MNEAMKQAWLQISAMMENPDTTELDIFLRTWQLAMKAEREECALLVEENVQECNGPMGFVLQSNADAIRARGQQ
jgi:uncharacterized glyoxalase superfamily metalloenzyme YdcJ